MPFEKVTVLATTKSTMCVSKEMKGGRVRELERLSEYAGRQASTNMNVKVRNSEDNVE